MVPERDSLLASQSYLLTIASVLPHLWLCTGWVGPSSGPWDGNSIGSHYLPNMKPMGHIVLHHDICNHHIFTVKGPGLPIHEKCQVSNIPHKIDMTQQKKPSHSCLKRCGHVLRFASDHRLIYPENPPDQFQRGELSNFDTSLSRNSIQTGYIVVEKDRL